MFMFGLLKKGGLGPPRTDLLLHAKRFDATTETMLDRIGGSARTVQDRQYMQCDGTGYFASASIVGTEAVVSKEGTGTASIAAGRLNCTAGTLWSVVLSNGSRYEFATRTGTTSAVAFDVSGNGRHLTATSFADVAALCATSKTVGSDWANTQGMSAGGLGQELITAEADRTFSSDTGWWTKNGGWSIAGGVATHSGTVSENFTSANILTSGMSYRVTWAQGGGGGAVYVGSLATIDSNSTSTGTITITTRADGTSLTFRTNVAGSFVDNVSIKLSVEPTGIIPALASNPAIDALGNATQYPGRAKYSVVPVSAKCGTFAGVSDRINVGPMPWGTGDVTISAEFVLDDLVDRGSTFAGSIVWTDGAYAGYRLGIMTSGAVAFFRGTSGVTNTVNSPVSTIVAGTIYKLSITYNATTGDVTGTLNGTPLVFNSGNPMANYTQPVNLPGNNCTIGASDSARWFKGKLYNVNINGVQFPLTEGAGTTVRGYSTNGTVYTGTITAADINAFWAGSQSTYFPGLEYGYRLSGSVQIPANPYTPGLACDGNAITAQPGRYNASASYQLQGGEVADALYEHLGPELLTTAQQQFDSGVILYGNGSITGGSGNLTIDGTTNNQVRFDSILSTTATYRVTYTVTERTGNGTIFSNAISGSDIGTPNIAGTIGAKDFTFSNPAVTYFGFRTLGGTSGTFKVDNLSIRQVDPLTYPESDYFNSDGTAKTLTYAQLLAAADGDQAFLDPTGKQGLAIYDTVQTDPTLTKIKKRMNLI